MTKTLHLNTHRRALAIETESLEQKPAERVNGMIGSVYDLVGVCANTRHRLALVTDCSEQSVAFFRGMRTACFAEAILQDVVRSFKEENKHLQSETSQLVQLFFKIGEKAAFANINHEGGASDSLFFIL